MTHRIHSSVSVSKFAVLDISTKGTKLVIGENSVIDDFVKIKHVGGSADIRIGANVYINSGTVIYSGNGVDIGDDVLIGPNCSIVPVNHCFESRETAIRNQGFAENRGGITIGNDVWMGAGVTIVDGVTIGKGAVIAANALVSRNVDQYAVVAGVPAVQVGER